MEKATIEELILKYNEGLADPTETKLLEKLIEEGKVQLTELRELHKFDEQIAGMEGPAPSMKLDDRFYSMLAEEKQHVKKKSVSFSWPQWSVLAPRLSFAAVLLIAGFGVGMLVQRPADNREVQKLNDQVGELKEMMMLSLLEKESTTDRLRAVSLTSEMGTVSQKVTGALFKTLNEDENVNVRLAALEALTVYVKDSKVREGLVLAISKQDSPMVQIALAELMVSMQEKKSVKALKGIMDNEKTPKEVKSKIEESLKVLI